MTDMIDVAQQRQQDDIDHALANRRAAGPGLTHCENMDCGEAISKARQLLGARLCLDCQQASELEATRWAPRAHG